MAEDRYWGDEAEIKLPDLTKAQKLPPQPVLFSAEAESFVPDKLTIAWVEAQLPAGVWKENRSSLTPSMVKYMAELAGKGCSKRAILARCGFNVNTWANWEKRAAEGEQPYALWYQLVQYYWAGKEIELLSVIDRHANLDWKAAQFRLKTLNRDEYHEASPVAGTTVNINNNDNSKTETTINRLEAADVVRIAAIMGQVGVVGPAAIEGTVVDAEEVEDE